MKAKRYDPARPPAVSMEPDAGGDWVMVEDYYSLLELARELRAALIFQYGREPFSPQPSATCNCQKCVALRDSAWLEE